MTLMVLAIVFGLVLLVWSADKFIEGASATAYYAGMPPILIGMIVVGFGTSAPEMVVSTIAALENNPGIALGNAYGSNIANIGLILGLTVLLKPLVVHSDIVKKELPLLIVFSFLAGSILIDGTLDFHDGYLLLLGFFILVCWSIYSGLKKKDDALGTDVEQEVSSNPHSLKYGVFWLITGLVLLIGSSRLLVWGSVSLAQTFGVSDLIIGLTIIAIGTSLPELASSLVAVYKNEHDIAVGNVVGSNMFNILAVIGIAGSISETPVSEEVLYRDWVIMILLTLLLYFIVVLQKKESILGRKTGILFLLIFFSYLIYLVFTTLNGN
jgi:cation:H+ antiporter